jgi:hypothetical protein
VHAEQRRQDAGHEALCAPVALSFGRDRLAVFDRFRDGRRPMQGGYRIVDCSETDLSSFVRDPCMLHRAFGGSGCEAIASRGAVRPGEQAPDGGEHGVDALTARSLEHPRRLFDEAFAPPFR